MSPGAISLIAFAIIFGGTLLGMYLRTVVNEQHLSADSRDVMKLGTTTIATLAALVLGLMISSAKGSFDTINSIVKGSGSKIILLDRTMARYGPETREARDMLHGAVSFTIERIWPAGKTEVAVEKLGQSQRGIEEIEENLQKLSPRNDNQRQLQSKALQILGEIDEGRWRLLAQVGQISFPMPLVALLICWLFIIFFNFGLITTRNKTVLAILLVCAFSTASSLFVILELDQPFGGLLRISPDPLLKALQLIGK